MKTKNINILITRLETLLDSPQAARFNMRHFGNVYLGNLMSGTLTEFPPACNTQACLAGETTLALGTGHLLKSGGIAIGRSTFVTSGSIVDQATTDLGLTPKQAVRLFYFKNWMTKDGWPEKFSEAYENAKTPQGRLYVAIRRVEHFLATKGRE